MVVSPHQNYCQCSCNGVNNTQHTSLLIGVAQAQVERQLNNKRWNEHCKQASNELVSMSLRIPFRSHCA